VGSWSLVVNAMLAPWMLGESTSRLDHIAAWTIIAGSESFYVLRLRQHLHPAPALDLSSVHFCDQNLFSRDDAAQSPAP